MSQENKNIQENQNQEVNLLQKLESRHSQTLENINLLKEKLTRLETQISQMESRAKNLECQISGILRKQSKTEQ